jgi:C1A family cysteine protease
MASVAAPLPASIDYRTLGCVGPVRDQGRCGSCWAHSIADAVGGALAKSGRPYIDLSVQQLLDCSTQDYGCGGGDTISGAEFVQRRGLMNESAYLYAAIAGTCRYRTAAATAHISGHLLLPNDERALAAALTTHGPLSAAINASPSSMQFYSTGIYRDRSCTGTMASLNHAVVLTGYTRDSWILKNSWGSDWGRQGYLYLARNSGNLCGVATYSVAMVA